MTKDEGRMLSSFVIRPSSNTTGGRVSLRVGQRAPDFALKSHLDTTVRLSDYRGKCNVVIAFFPLAWTPV
jgi:peroxiredoxin (alkyl hydroperoxide reductase subunit C)